MTRLTDADYACAEQLLAPYRARRIPGARITPEWLPGGAWFRYQVGSRHLVVDPAAGTRACVRVEGDEPAGPREFASLDRNWTAFGRDGDIWVRSRDGRQEFALTDDAEPHHDYGALPDPLSFRSLARSFGVGPPFHVSWSPDSTRLLVHRLDQRGLPEQVLVESAPSGGGPPVEHRYRYPQPGEDAQATMAWAVLHVTDRTVVHQQDPPPSSPRTGTSTCWSCQGPSTR